MVGDLDSGAIRDVPTAPGTILDLACGTDGAIHYLWSRSDIPPRQMSVSVATTVPSRPRVPKPLTSAAGTRPGPEFWTRTDYGAVHSFLMPPDRRDPPWRTIFLIHGGPATHDRDCYDARAAAIAKAGFAVVRTNYRGSTGYGVTWQREFRHRVGIAQLEDIAAVRSRLISDGFSIASRTGLIGYSWGGYLTLLAMGLQPDLWSVGVAVCPIADYVLAHALTAPALRAVDLDLFGGSPDDCPERYAAASPITYAARVQGRLLLIGAKHDERCPPEQIESYLAELRAHGVPHSVVWRDGGHIACRADDQELDISTAVRFLTQAWKANLGPLTATVSQSLHNHSKEVRI
jgi:dipeptidyl aminopeptidase/acylaminoacyl peptidase